MRFGSGTISGDQLLKIWTRPTFTSGERSGYAPGTPKHGWDHSTPYLRRMLGDLWGADLTVVERELTLAEVNPAMEPLRPMAAQMHAEALDAALAAGRAFGVVPPPETA